jgi:hypothetical protein
MMVAKIVPAIHPNGVKVEHQRGAIVAQGRQLYTRHGTQLLEMPNRYCPASFVPTFQALQLHQANSYWFIQHD